MDRKTARKTSKPKRPVESIHHKDKRKNIPTEELRDFVAEDEKAPTTMLYPRDPSLDPQLVWKGKDEQDREDLAVPVVPIYIQEKIQPQAIIDDFRRGTAFQAVGEHGQDGHATQLNLFADFNGLDDFEKKIDFYQHDQNWANRLILGDSLLVMTSLAEKEGLKGKVQCIYIDPPYGIKFGSNWQVSTRKRDVRDGKAQHATREPEQIRAFRDTWKLGIHSYLAYLRDRLVTARELLTETGSVFVQIGDENVHLVRNVLDEVLGRENFRSIITVRKTGGLGSAGLTTVADFLLWYAKDAERVKYRPLFVSKENSKTAEQYKYFRDVETGEFRSLKSGETLPPSARPFQPTAVHTMFAGVPSCLYEFEVDGKRFTLPHNRQWSTTLPNMLKLHAAGRLFTHGNTPRFVRYLQDFSVNELTNLWADVMGSDDKLYVVQTNTRVIERCVLMTTDPGDLVLDPTCGSGTTAYVAEQWGRRWITTDTSRVALALARTRLMAAKYPYYLLADSPEGIEKEAEISGTGILPVKHRQDADATGDTPSQAVEKDGRPGVQSHGEEGPAAPWDPEHGEIAKRKGAYLPHWTAEGATYSVTFRLTDSLPKTVLEGFLREREEILKGARKAGRDLTVTEERRLRELFSEKVERFLDAGHGKCVLQHDRAAAVVRDALAHFDGQRYDVLAWCVMPNHVHVILRPRSGHQLSDILHSWKSFTANQVNRLLRQTGTLWQAEYFDHLIRDAADGDRSVQYVLGNPESAGLKDWKWCGMGFQPMSVPAQDEPATKHGQDARATDSDIRKGFVYKRVPHVTLKSIANNPDIREGMTRKEIDAAIARHADQEMLFDQPYEDKKRIRVTGPFSVESLSPHRVLSTADENLDGTVTEAEARKQQDFVSMILDNLKKAGVQNTVKNERMKFDTLEPYAGNWIHAAGDYTDADEKSRRVAVSIGPEHGTVGPQQVKEAAKEAVQGVGFDVLIVCGFAFDPHVAEEAKRYGELTVLPTRMNNDLSMGDELLKKTGAGNLFMVFGEPDLDVKKQKDGKLVAEIKGLDVYDPTTGEIRNSSTDDIACWFIDTEYNGESFFVRHAYFTGAGEPYDKLKRALRAEIDEAAWSSLYSTTSRPFEPPETGKIAVKVINHYGDEVLKVFEV